MTYDDLQLISGDDYVVNEKIKIHHPTLGEIKAMGQDRYYAMLHAFISTPADCIVLLDDMGLDYETVEEFSLFAMLAKGIPPSETAILFGSVDFSKLHLSANKETQQLALVDHKSGIVIDKVVYEIISNYLRQIHRAKKNIERAGDAATKKVLIDEARRKANRPQRKSATSLAQIVLKLTNTSDFKYDIFNVWKLPIYVFMSSFDEVQKGVYWNHLMQGVYAGNVDRKKISNSELSWFREG